MECGNFAQSYRNFCELQLEVIVRYNATERQAEQTVGPERWTDKALITNHFPLNLGPKGEAGAQKLSQLTTTIILQGDSIFF